MKLRWKLGLIFGVTAFILTYIFSITNNTWLPAMFRAFVGLLVFTGLGILLQYFIELFLPPVDKDWNSSERPETAKMAEVPNQQGTEEQDFQINAEDPTKPADDEGAFQSIPLEMLQKENSSGSNAKL